MTRGDTLLLIVALVLQWWIIAYVFWRESVLLRGQLHELGQFLRKGRIEVTRVNSEKTIVASLTKEGLPR
jgi:hypothetical protein